MKLFNVIPMKTIRSSALILSSLLAVSCTQRMSKLQTINNSYTQHPLTTSVRTLDTIYQQSRMVSNGNYLYAFGTGPSTTVGGFGIYDILNDYFASRRDLLDSSQGGINVANPTFGAITATVYAQNSIFVSCALGLVRLFPNAQIQRDGNGVYISRYQVYGSDYRYQWSSAVYIPGTNWILGFSGTKMFQLNITTPDVAPVPVDLMVSGSLFDISCGTGAAFYQDRIYVAGCTRLLEIRLTGSSIIMEALNLDFNPINVVSTNQFLYLQHKPSGGMISSSYEAGIYQFDTSIQRYNYAQPRAQFYLADVNRNERQPMPFANSFAVSADDTKIFANIDERNINMFQIQ